jgi:formate dehydrogenase subunit gamma
MVGLMHACPVSDPAATALPSAGDTSGEPDLRARVRAVVAAHTGERGALLPILHDLQGEFGYVPPGAVPLLAGELNLSRADVHGVLTFYRDFRSEPPGRTIVRLCRAEACQSVGAEALVAAVEERFGAPVGATTADGAVTLAEVYCLGNCALGPSASIDGVVVGRAGVDRLAALVAERAGAAGASG